MPKYANHISEGEELLLSGDVFDDQRGKGVRTTEFIISLLISICFFSSFIAFYFFFITAQVEATVVKKNIDRVINELFGDLNKFLSPSARQLVHFGFQQLKAPNLSTQDKLVQEKNHGLVIQTIQLTSLLVCVSALIILLIWATMKGLAKKNAQSHVDYPDILRIVKENLILLGFVIAAELLFLFAIAANHRNLDSNDIKHKAIQTIRNFINN